MSIEKYINNPKGLHVAVLAASATGEIFGGAERFYKALTEAFIEKGCRAELVPLPANEGSFDEIVENYKRSSELDLSTYDVVVSTKAPTYAVNHHRHVLYLVHTVRSFDDMFWEAFPRPHAKQFLERAELQALEFQAISKIRARFAIGHEVANRLFRWKGISAEVLHPPIGLSNLRRGLIGDYFFLPGRLHPWKRIDLLIEAVLGSELPINLVIAGTGEAESPLRKLAGNDPRIKFVGKVTDEQLIGLYENALAVPFVPIREDYGYVTLEAFASGKPVLTCCDSGEPAYFVRHGETGLICSPDPRSVRDSMEWFFHHREDAKTMGERGYSLTRDMSWGVVVDRILEAAFGSSMPTKENSNVNVAALDMQPIDPPVGGGRLRLLGLLHNLGKGVNCQYVGSYDWLGEEYRRHRLSPSLEEIDTPLSEAHYAAANELAEMSGGKVVIDISFGRLGHLSPAYLKAACDSIRRAEVVIFSHPWVYPLVREVISPNQVVIYDAHNVEGYLRALLLDETNPTEASLLRGVVQDEYDLGLRADMIFACSQEDLQRFNRIYEFPCEKIRVIPNGVMVSGTLEVSTEEKQTLRTLLKVEGDKFVAIFIGSQYLPNQEAVNFILDSLADELPEVLFVIAGGVGQSIRTKKLNVRVVGKLTEEEKQRWLCVSDIAVNPMFSGSGTNIKMFDFMAHRLPIVTTEIGARGIERAGYEAMVVVENDVGAFAGAIARLHDPVQRIRMGREARACVEEGYAWERISELAGAIIASRKLLASQPRPKFSVVIPTYERHDQLEALIRSLQSQIERDFEVIVVDQSSSRWPGENDEFGFPLVYFHTPIKGAVRARNTGASIAQGEVVVFTDDDCLPDAAWLLHARAYFCDEDIVGLEGMVVSDHIGEPNWRPVTNVGFEGIGFMTANLMVRAEYFHRLGGFDLLFDKPHFREDTDFGWRLQMLGKVPYAREVKVFHPAQPRSTERESEEVRVQFFQKDALLYRKHPERYRELFMRERHFERSIGFLEHLRLGFEMCRVEPPDWMKGYLREVVDIHHSRR